MILTLLRHGQAGTAAYDEARELTSLGVSQTEQCCQSALDFLMPPLDMMVVSPYQRAQQTAEIARQYFLPKFTITTDVLTPESPLPVLIELLNEKISQLETQAPSILLVGHQPLLGNLLSYLTGDRHMAYGVTTSSLSVLELDALVPGFASLIKQYVP